MSTIREAHHLSAVVTCGFSLSCALKTGYLNFRSLLRIGDNHREPFKAQECKAKWQQTCILRHASLRYVYLVTKNLQRRISCLGLSSRETTVSNLVPYLFYIFNINRKRSLTFHLTTHTELNDVFLS